jgi:hypothetical protein
VTLKSNDAESVQPAPVLETITCNNCEREVPHGSLHCPHCCGEDGLRGSLQRGAFTGGILGLIAGGVGAAFFLSIFGSEYNTWTVVSGIVLCFVLVGAGLGIKNSRSE